MKNLAGFYENIIGMKVFDRKFDLFLITLLQTINKRSILLHKIHVLVN